MAVPNIQPIPLANLLVDLINPRHNQQPNQREAISTIAFDQGLKLVNLGQDIINRGLSLNDFPMVTPADEEGMYIVLEGNRRVAAMKLMASPPLLKSIGLPKNITMRFRDLHESASDIPSEVYCSVVDRDEARHWIEQKHTGENNGIGIVMWDGRQTQRFRGMSPALQAIELVEESNYVDDETKKKLQKIAITNVERILETPDARRFLGVDVQKGELVFTIPEEEALGRLAMVIGDIANKRIKVSDLDKKEQRVNYAKEISERPLPNAVGGSGGNSGDNGGGTPSVKPSMPRRILPDRKFLIPKSCKLAIDQARINKIYHELQGMEVEKYTNSCAVMFRVFIELCLDHYGQAKKLSFKVTTAPKPPATQPGSRDMSLREKIKAVYEYMESNSIADKNQLRGIKSLYANKDHVLSVDSLNAYVHNKDFHPKATDLKTDWDNIQPFVEKLWIA